MKTALTITLAFVAATSALGGLRNIRTAQRTRYPAEYLGALVAFCITIWCAYLACWVYTH